MTYELTVGLRYLKSRRRQTFISLITLISVGGVAVGVMVLIVVLAVMSGFETSLKEKILGINSHIWILPQTPGRLEGYQDIVARVALLPHVTFAAPFTTNEVMLVAEGHVSGTIVRGLDLEHTDQMAELMRHLQGQDLRALLELPPRPPGEAPATCCQPRGPRERTARHLLVFGQQVMLTSPSGAHTSWYAQHARLYRHRDLRYRHVRIRRQIALMSFARRRLRVGEMHGIELKVDDIYRVYEVEQPSAVYSVRTFDWLDTNESQLVCGVAPGKVLIFIIQLIILVAAFNIVNVNHAVMENSVDIAILKAMGGS